MSTIFDIRILFLYVLIFFFMIIRTKRNTNRFVLSFLFIILILKIIENISIDKNIKGKIFYIFLWLLPIVLIFNLIYYIKDCVKNFKGKNNLLKLMWILFLISSLNIIIIIIYLIFMDWNEFDVEKDVDNEFYKWKRYTSNNIQISFFGKYSLVYILLILFNFFIFLALNINNIRIWITILFPILLFFIMGIFFYSDIVGSLYLELLIILELLIYLLCLVT